MKKKILLLALVVITLISSTVLATVDVQLNGKIIDFTDENGDVVKADIINGRTMVPMRKIFELFDAKVDWDNDERKVTATTDEKIITLKIDNVEASIEDVQTKKTETVTLDSAPVIVDGRTLVPARFIAESLGKQVGWDNYNRCAIIIDYDTIANLIRENAPALVELIEMEKDDINSFKANAQVTGSIIYKDKAQKANNETVKIAGDALVQKNKDNAYGMDLNLKASGTGEIINALKEEGLENIKMSIVGNNEVAYLKTNLMPESNNKKWISGSALFDGSINENIHSVDELVELIKFDEEYLDIYSYQDLTTALDLVYMIYGGDNFKVSGTTTKRFELNLDVAELINDFASLYSSQAIDLFSDGSMNAKVVMTYKDKKPTKSTVEFVAYIEDVNTKESIKIDLNVDMTYSSINSDISINMPKKSDIVETALQKTAYFAAFCQEFGDYGTNFLTEPYAEICYNYGIKGMARTKAQMLFEAADSSNKCDVNTIVPAGVEFATALSKLKDAKLYDYSGNDVTEKVWGAKTTGQKNDTNDVACWQIARDAVEGYEKFYFYSNDETNWVTEKGDIFTLPGLEREVDGEIRRYINIDTYYISNNNKVINARDGVNTAEHVR